MTNCDRYQEMISRMLDGELSRAERDELAEHVQRCPDCAAVYVAFRSLSENLSGELEEVPPALHENIMADVRRENLRAKNSVHTSRRWHYALTAAACLVLVAAAGLSLPKIAARKGLADQAAPAEAEMIEESVMFDSGTNTLYREADTRQDVNSGLSANAMPEMPAEEPAEAAAEEVPAEDAEYQDGVLILNEAKSAALEELMTGEKQALDGSPDRELRLMYHHKGALRTLTVLLRGEKAFYVQADGDSYCRFDASAQELLELLGLDE